MSAHERASSHMAWVDVAKGTAILLVVLWHAHLLGRDHGGFPEVLSRINVALANVRMPLFFLASGLLMERLVTRPWGDLLARRVVPMAWLLVVWTLIGSTFNLVTPLYPWVHWPLPSLLDVLWNPQGNLWFVYALLIFAVLGRLVAMARQRWRIIVGLSVWIALLLYDRESGHQFVTKNMVQFWPFYAFGLLGGSQIKTVTASRWATGITAAICLIILVSLARFGVGGFVGSGLGNLFGAGLLATLAVAMQDLPVVAPLLMSAGRNSLAIYVGHTPMLATLYAVLDVPWNSPLVWIGSFVVAVVGALLLERGAQRLRLGWLYRVPTGLTDRVKGTFGSSRAAGRS